MGASTSPSSTAPAIPSWPPSRSGIAPYGVAVNPTTNRIYVTNHGSRRLLRHRWRQQHGRRRRSGRESPRGRGRQPHHEPHLRGELCISSVSVIDGAGNAVVASVGVGSTLRRGRQPHHGPHLRDELLEQQRFRHRRRRQHRRRHRSDRAEPDGVAVNPNTNRIYVANN